MFIYLFIHYLAIRRHVLFVILTTPNRIV